MDRLIYTAMSGTKHIMEQQATVSNNLANVTTNGFKAQLNSFRAVPVQNADLNTRTFVVDSTVGTDFSTGVLQQTGRELDFALKGPGWFVVEQADGTEAYTRYGSLKISENGVLQTQNGLNLVGDGGPITIPPDMAIEVAKDGTVSAIPIGSRPSGVQVLGRLKLVNPEENNLMRLDNGLFKTKDGSTPDSDINVTVVGGMLEGSNVNAVECMVSMINLARSFDLQMKLLQNAENNASKASQILTLS